MKEARCINCGCTDRRACVDVFGDPCYWCRLDMRRGLGVCSTCAPVIRIWDALKPKARDTLKVLLRRVHVSREAIAQFADDHGITKLLAQVRA